MEAVHPPKHLWSAMELLGIRYRKMVFFTVTAERTTDPIYEYYCNMTAETESLY
jgi:hypothetical protein